MCPSAGFNSRGQEINGARPLTAIMPATQQYNRGRACHSTAAAGWEANNTESRSPGKGAGGGDAAAQRGPQQQRRPAPAGRPNRHPCAASKLAGRRETREDYQAPRRPAHKRGGPGRTLGRARYSQTRAFLTAAGAEATIAPPGFWSAAWMPTAAWLQLSAARGKGGRTMCSSPGGCGARPTGGRARAAPGADIQTRPGARAIATCGDTTCDMMGCTKAEPITGGGGQAACAH
jgi:hypothetical protein